MGEWLSRTEQLIGEKNVKILQNSCIAVFGIGGVGSFVAEALVRSGIGKIILVDNDTVDPSNINRQLIADTTTIGEDKVSVAKRRYLNINPNLEVVTYKEFFNNKTSSFLIDPSYDYIIDAIDSVSSKIHLIEKAKEFKIPIISCMGTGNKLDPTRFEIADISKTSVCPLAKVMRKELKNRNISNVKVLYSKEEPLVKSASSPASISFVPSVAGLIIASQVVKDLLKKD